VDPDPFGAAQYIGSPKLPTVSVYSLFNSNYQVQRYQSNQPIISPTFPQLQLTAEQVLKAGKYAIISKLWGNLNKSSCCNHRSMIDSTISPDFIERFLRCDQLVQGTVVIALITLILCAAVIVIFTWREDGQFLRRNNRKTSTYSALPGQLVSEELENFAKKMFQ
jgi:hypothetical protein